MPLSFSLTARQNKKGYREQALCIRDELFNPRYHPHYPLVPRTAHCFLDAERRRNLLGHARSAPLLRREGSPSGVTAEISALSRSLCALPVLLCVFTAFDDSIPNQHKLRAAKSQVLFLTSQGFSSGSLEPHPTISECRSPISQTRKPPGSLPSCRCRGTPPKSFFFWSQ